MAKELFFPGQISVLKKPHEFMHQPNTYSGGQLIKTDSLSKRKTDVASVWGNIHKSSIVEIKA